MKGSAPLTPVWTLVEITESFTSFLSLTRFSSIFSIFSSLISLGIIGFSSFGSSGLSSLGFSSSTSFGSFGFSGSSGLSSFGTSGLGSAGLLGFSSFGFSGFGSFGFSGFGSLGSFGNKGQILSHFVPILTILSTEFSIIVSSLLTSLEFSMVTLVSFIPTLPSLSTIILPESKFSSFITFTLNAISDLNLSSPSVFEPYSTILSVFSITSSIVSSFPVSLL